MQQLHQQLIRAHAALLAPTAPAPADSSSAAAVAADSSSEARSSRCSDVAFTMGCGRCFPRSRSNSAAAAAAAEQQRRRHSMPSLDAAAERRRSSVVGDAAAGGTGGIRRSRGAGSGGLELVAEEGDAPRRRGSFLAYLGGMVQRSRSSLSEGQQLQRVQLEHSTAEGRGSGSSSALSAARGSGSSSALSASSVKLGSDGSGSSSRLSSGSSGSSSGAASAVAAVAAVVAATTVVQQNQHVLS
jgi:hypothetical protein